MLESSLNLFIILCIILSACWRLILFSDNMNNICGAKVVLDEGDDCFAHVKGYPWWPARITEKRGNKRFCVIFYGTNEVAQLPKQELKPVSDETIKKFVTSASLKRKGFKKGFGEMTGQPPDNSSSAGADPKQDDNLKDISNCSPNRKCSGRIDSIAINQHEDRSKFVAALSAALDLEEPIDEIEITVKIEALPNLECLDSVLDVIGYAAPRVHKGTAGIVKEVENDSFDTEKELVNVSNIDNLAVVEGENESTSKQLKKLVDVPKQNTKKSQVVKAKKVPLKSRKKAPKNMQRSLREDELEGNKMFAESVEIRDGSYFCRKCNKFSTITELLARSHARICGKVFKKKGRPMKLTSCMECGEAFSSMKDLKTHHKREHICGHYICSTCVRQFTHRASYIRHIRSHKDPPQLQCPQIGCSKSFRYKCNLKRHIATHSKEMQVLRKVGVLLMFFIPWLIL